MDFAAQQQGQQLGDAQHPVAGKQDERVIVRVRPHGWRLVLPVVLLIVTAGVAGYWVGNLPEAWMNVALAVALGVFAFLTGVLPVLVWLSTRATITSRRVIWRRGYARESRRDVLFSAVYEVRRSRSLGQRLRGCATVELLHGSEVLRLVDVPDGVAIHELCQELMEQNFIRAQSHPAPQFLP